MRLDRGRVRWRRRLAALFVVLSLALPQVAAAASPPASNAAGEMMRSGGWLERIALAIEGEAVSDFAMLPDAPGALVREWRSFGRDGSALDALANLGWVALTALLAILAERLVARGLGWRRRRAMRLRPEGPTVGGLLLLLGCDIAGLAVFVAAFVYARHFLLRLGVTAPLIVFAANVLIRWRIAALVVRVLLRPGEPIARLVEVAEPEARRLAWILSATILAVIVLVGIGRYGLMDEDSGAPHVVALLVSVAVCGLDAFLVIRARAVAEALIRGRGGGLAGAFRAAVARAWVGIGLAGVAGLFVFFVFGLSLGLLSYYHATGSTVGVLLVLLVLDRLADKGWQQAGPASAGVEDRLVAQSLRRMMRAAAVLVGAVVLASLWTGAVRLPGDAAERARHSAYAAIGTLFVAYIAWEVLRLFIDRQLQGAAIGPRLPGAADEIEAAPGSRLQTILPMLRAGFAALIAVVASLIVLSRLGVDTAPLIAGAGVFGLAISFGSQSLVRDIISGLFYIWDDAFRVGEYIDTGRLKGTVEALGIRSIKLRHHNGPLHTIPYGQLGAVTNLSRDFATVKFNLRLEPGTDIELVRKTAKRIGLDLQDNPEIAAEVILPLKMQGIAEITDNAVVLRFKFTVRPVKPSWVQREYVKAMYRVFAEKGIQFARGALTLQTVSAAPFAARPVETEAEPAASRVA